MRRLDPTARRIVDTCPECHGEGHYQAAHAEAPESCERCDGAGHTLVLCPDCGGEMDHVGEGPCNWCASGKADDSVGRCGVCFELLLPVEANVCGGCAARKVA